MYVLCRVQMRRMIWTVYRHFQLMGLWEVSGRLKDSFKDRRRAADSDAIGRHRAYPKTIRTGDGLYLLARQTKKAETCLHFVGEISPRSLPPIVHRHRQGWSTNYPVDQAGLRVARPHPPREHRREMQLGGPPPPKGGVPSVSPPMPRLTRRGNRYKALKGAYPHVKQMAT